MSRFLTLRAALALKVSALPEVQGLVWAGSAAEVERADEWSDLDFFLIVQDGVQEDFRTNLSWLPDDTLIAWTARETEHGLKVVYSDGFVLEFAVFTRDELSCAVVNHHAVEFGDDNIKDRVRAIHRPEPMPARQTVDDYLGMAYAQLLIGAGRFLRGERLVGNLFVHSYVISQILAASQLALVGQNEQSADSLDPWRRVEQRYPVLAAELSQALALEVPQAALEIGEIMFRYFGHMSEVPGAALPVLQMKLHPYI